MRILIIDDERSFIRMLSRHLQRDGYEIEGAVNSLEGLRLAHEWKPDLILLDIRMPGVDGHEIMRRLRETSQVPIIVLSVLGDEADIVRGLGTGADAYLVKPFHVSELRARIRALLRRATGSVLLPGQYYHDEYLLIDLYHALVEKNGSRVGLSGTEFKLLTCLLEKRGRVVSKDELFDAAWGHEETLNDHLLSLAVGHLRRKIEDAPHHPFYIRTRFRVGYWFHGQDDPDPK